MKLTPLVILLLILQLVIMIANSSYSVTDSDLNPYNATENLNQTENLMWDFITDPTDWGQTGFLAFWTVFGALGLGTIVVTAIGLITRSDMLILSAVPALFLGFGAIPIISLYELITREVAFFGCVVTTPPTACGMATMAFILTGGLLGLFYAMAIIEWWTNRQTS